MPGDRPERGGVDRQFVGVVPAAVAIAVCHSRQARIGQVAVQVSVGCPWAMPTFLDAAAVNALLLGSRSGARRGVPLILVAVPPHVRRVLKMLNLDDALAHAGSVREALVRTDEAAGGLERPSTPGLRHLTD